MAEKKKGGGLDRHDRTSASNGGKPVSANRQSPAVNAFLQKVAAMPNVKPAAQRGRLLFGMDATASRERTWDTACQIQGEMFEATDTLGGLDVQLIYYRGFRQLKKTPWISSSKDLIAYMTGVRCLGGHTQLERVLRFAVAESKRQKINAFVFVGDCLEENIDDVCDAAGALGLLGVPCFMFHEGYEPTAMAAFKQVATLTSGAYLRFDASSAHELKQLLAAVAVYAAGGRRALSDYSRHGGESVRLLTHQLK